jgi:aspartyl-tRNA(Asn)/glutamyl-tRNA(Gln) amidotransferase subunit A
LAHLLSHPAGQVGEKLTEAIRQGQAIPERQYLDDRGEIDPLRAAYFKSLPKTDAFLWPAASGTAPEGLAWTGDPQYISPWTALGGPIVTMPSGPAANGLPVGCLLIGRPGSGARHAVVATKLAEVAERRT